MTTFPVYQWPPGPLGPLLSETYAKATSSLVDLSVELAAVGAQRPV
jgi:hypothetical protein